MDSALLTAPLSSQERAGRRQINILILEENTCIEELLRWTLVTGGYHHLVTAQDMSRLAQPGQYADIVLFDFDSSLSWWKEIERQWHGAHMCAAPGFLMLTCHAHRKYKLEAYGLKVLMKPFHVRDLLDSIELLVTRERSLSTTMMQWCRTIVSQVGTIEREKEFVLRVYT